MEPTIDVQSLQDRLIAIEEILLHHEGRIVQLEHRFSGRDGYIPPHPDRVGQDEHEARIAAIETRLKMRRANDDK